MNPCIFCGNAADSKEDLFPRWILKRVNTRQPLSRQLGDAPPEITEDQEVRLPCVCQRCATRSSRNGLFPTGRWCSPLDSPGAAKVREIARSRARLQPDGGPRRPSGALIARRT